MADCEEVAMKPSRLMEFGKDCFGRDFIWKFRRRVGWSLLSRGLPSKLRHSLTDAARCLSTHDHRALVACIT